MDRWRWEQLAPWFEIRASMPVGALLCVIDGRTTGRPWAASGARDELRQAAARAGVRRRFAPHQLRHAHARWRWLVRAFRLSSSNGSWVMRISASHPCICAASITPRSSTPSTSAERR
jgi:integrase